ncbi:hypothetical protein ACJX0J_041951, partial [Zea mays]
VRLIDRVKRWGSWYDLECDSDPNEWSILGMPNAHSKDGIPMKAFFFFPQDPYLDPAFYVFADIEIKVHFFLFLEAHSLFGFHFPEVYRSSLFLIFYPSLLFVIRYEH